MKPNRRAIDSRICPPWIFCSPHTKLLNNFRSSVKKGQILTTILRSGPEVLIVRGVYKSPNYPIDEFLALLGDHMTKLKSKEARKHVNCGDFNINVFLEDQKINRLIEMLSYFGFQLTNNRMATRETHCSKTCFELFFSKFEGVCNVDKTALSDHYTVYFSAIVFANLEMTAASPFINSQFKKGETLERNKLSSHLEIKEQRLIKESLDIDQSIVWLQQKISSSKESVIPTVH